jgi:hypothetical protein
VGRAWGGAMRRRGALVKGRLANGSACLLLRRTVFYKVGLASSAKQPRRPDPPQRPRRAIHLYGYNSIVIEGQTKTEGKASLPVAVKGGGRGLHFAAARRSTNCRCSSEARPAFNTASIFARSLAQKAATSSHKPEKTRDLTMPSASTVWTA